MRKFATMILIGVVGASVALAPAPAAHAADTKYYYAASTGGTYVRIFDGTVQSDFTAQSSVTGGPNSAFAKNSTTAANVEGLLRVGAVETATTATVDAAGTKLHSFARTANVDLLDGLITANAVETNITTVARPDGTASASGGSRLLGIHIEGVDLPVDIPENYQVTIPRVASVTLNYRLHAQADGVTVTRGWAIGVSLIKPRDGYAAGTTVLINPVNHRLAAVVPSPGAKLSGFAYGTRVRADVGDGVQVVSDPTARVSTPLYSSNGKTIRNTTLGVNVPGLLTTNEVSSTTTSTKDDLGNAEIRNDNQLAQLNVLNGLIKADALKVVAYGRVRNGFWISRMWMSFANLVVAGQEIPVDVGPNTIIDVAGLGEVAINVQWKNPKGTYQNRIDGIRITLDTERAGLPVGAVIEIGVASTAIVP